MRALVGQFERSSISRQYCQLVAAAKQGGDTRANGWIPDDWPAFVVTRLQRLGEDAKEEIIDLLLLRHLIALHLHQPKSFRGAVKDEAKALSIPSELFR